MSKLIGERIKQAREDARLTQDQLAAVCGVSRSAVTQWENGNTKNLKANNLLGVKKATKRSLEWLLTGHDPGTSDEFEAIPLVESFYHGGDGDGMHHPKEPKFLKSLSFRSDWLEYEGLDPSHLKVAMVHGKSMQPTLREADIILVDQRSNALSKTNDEDIYALVYNEKPLVKRVIRQETGDVSLESDNPKFRPIDIKQDQLADLEIIGRVVWAGGKVR
jgi:phage repressor protein C with HTH and peptisase S24 domain